MLTTTAKLLQRQGYHGTGLNQIVAEAEAPKGSLYFHFPGGKEQLVAEALGVAGDYLDRVLAAHDRGATLESVDAYLVAVARFLEQSGYAEGCPIATVALEVGPISLLVGDACSAAFDLTTVRLVQWLERDGYTEGDARRTAFVIHAALEGALVFAKARRSVEPLDELRAALPLLLPKPRRRAAAARA
jgi:TetR/AcrR family transcriptional repressor of lmrAB and yxaGH operons